MELNEKVAFVTGAGRGIGRGIAERLCAAGVRTVLASRTWETVKDVAEKLRAGGADCIALRCDVTDRDQIADAIGQCVEKYGQLDVLVNNAQNFGTEAEPTPALVTKPLEAFPWEEVEFTFRGGLGGSLWAMQAAFPHLKASEGAAVVNFGSAAGYRGQVGIVAYNVTKEAIRALTRTAAREWGEYGITVNNVVPAITTDAIRGFFADKAELYETTVANIPLRRLGDPYVDGGGLVSYLAGPDARFITGMSIEVDGGSLMHP